MLLTYLHMYNTNSPPLPAPPQPHTSSYVYPTTPSAYHVPVEYNKQNTCELRGEPKVLTRINPPPFCGCCHLGSKLRPQPGFARKEFQPSHFCFMLCPQTPHCHPPPPPSPHKPFLPRLVKEARKKTKRFDFLVCVCMFFLTRGVPKSKYAQFEWKHHTDFDCEKNKKS